jgi:hypothetical protein
MGCPALHLDSRYLDVSLIQSMLIDLKSLMRKVYPPVRAGETHPSNGPMRCAGQGTGAERESAALQPAAVIFFLSDF